MSQYLTLKPSETKKKGKTLAKKVLKRAKNKDKAVVLGLEGELGGGKTTFLQGFAKGLGIKEKILSPTFVIYRRYETEEINFYHFDCYRVGDHREIKKLGFEEIIKGKGNIVAVEWADKIKKIMPSDTIWIDFLFQDKNKREIRI